MYILKEDSSLMGKMMIEVSLRVLRDDKMLIASNRELGIVTQGKNWNALMKNIKEVIECYFDIPSADIVKINLEIVPMVSDDAEKASC